MTVDAPAPVAKDDGALDVAWARSQFPTIRRNDFVYMDNAGGSAVLETVALRVADYLMNTNVQLGASYKTSKASTHLVHLGNVASQRFINAASLSEVVLGPSTTQLVENLARSMESGLKGDEEIIISETDHEGNVGPWVKTAQRKGLTLKVWKVNRETLELDLEVLRGLLTERTRIVAVTHCSNILGTINPVRRIADLVHTIPGCQVIVDGVAFAPHRAIDVQALGVDYYVFSWYKVYGPHISLLYVNEKAWERLSSLAHFFIPKSERPYALQPGNCNYELSAALPGVLAYIGDLARAAGSRLGEKGRTVQGDDGASRAEIAEAFRRVEAWETVLAGRLLGYLGKWEGWRVVGRAGVEGRVPTVAFVMQGRASKSIVEEVDGEGVGIRFGHFYAHRLCVGALGLDEEDGVVRVSLVHYNTLEEVDKLISVLERIRKRAVGTA
ncbi:hypothetical protein HK101_002684 [Irineochytrium annulatum]|nr:hypothetical protein HK101_002684 [Irineochytrium annulatum]